MIRHYLSGFFMFLMMAAVVSSATAATSTTNSLRFKPTDSFVIQYEGISGNILCGQKKKNGTFYSGKWVKVQKKKFFLMDDSKALKRLVKTTKGKVKAKYLKQYNTVVKKLAVCKKGRDLFITPTPTPAPTEIPPATVLAPLSRPVTREDINHLYRRAGLGAPSDAALQFIGRSSGELVDYFMTYTDEPGLTVEANTWLDENPAAPHYPEAGSFISQNGLIAYAMTILRKSNNPFHDKLALLILADRLVVSSDGVTQEELRPLLLQYMALLRRASQDFDYAALLRDIGEQGAMIKYLTLDQNTKRAPNENYARELMELFSLGTTDRNGNPNYTNEDIRQVARAFTGWSIRNINGVPYTVIFNTSQFDAGDKTIFAGTPYEGHVRTGRDVVDHILGAHPSAPISLAKFLAEHYLDATPSTAVVDEMAAMLKADGFNMRRALRTLLISEEFYKPQHKLAVWKTLPERLVHIWRVMDRPEIQMPFDYMERIRRLAEGKCVPTKHESVFGCLEQKYLPDGLEMIRSYNQPVFMSRDYTRFTNAGWTYARFFPVAQPTDLQFIDRMAELFGVELTEPQRAAMKTYLNNTLKNDKVTLLASPFNPNDATQVRKRGTGLFNLFYTLPQVHDNQ